MILLGVVAALALGAVAAATIGGNRIRARYDAEKADLLRQGRETRPTQVDTAAVAQLPAPVRRYLDVTHSLDRPGLRVAVLQQRGSLRSAADAPWMPFEAEQVYTMDPPGFVWLARAQMAGALSLWARDKFVGEKGEMLIRLLGFITVADAKGPTLDQGAGLRYWGEIIAFPEMVTHPDLQWEAIDERRARMQIKQGGLAMQADVEFDDAGYPITIRAERYRDVDGASILTPWSGHCRDWQDFGDRMFPTQWVSVWHTPEGDLEAVRIDVTGMTVE